MDILRDNLETITNWVVIFSFLGVCVIALAEWVKRQTAEAEIEKLNLERAENRRWWSDVCLALVDGDLELLSSQIQEGDLYDVEKLNEVLSDRPSFFDGKSPNDLRGFIEEMKELHQERRPVLPV